MSLFKEILSFLFLAFFASVFICPYMVSGDEKTDTCTFWQPQIETVGLKPQGNGFLLWVRGKAPLSLKGGFLTVAVLYAGQTVCWANTTILDLKDRQTDNQQYLPFILKLRKFTQSKVLSGPYEIRLYFFVQRQAPNLRPYFQRILAQYKKAKHIQQIAPATQKVYVRDEEAVAREDAVLRSYYAERIVFARFLLDQLDQKSQQALAVAYDPKPDNHFVKPGENDTWPREFAKRKWQAWFKQWVKEVKREEYTLLKYQRRVLALRYPHLFKQLQLLVNHLLKYGSFKSKMVYQVNKVGNRQLSHRCVPTSYLYRSIRKILTKIQSHPFFITMKKEFHAMLAKGQRRWGYQHPPCFINYFPPLELSPPPTGKEGTPPTNLPH